MRARTNIDLKDRRTLTLKSFRGVDFSSAIFDINERRASNMRNIINMHGVNCKRNGWREIFRIENESREAYRINGFWRFKNYYIVHAGARIYRVYEIDGDYVFSDITESSTYAPSVVDPDRLRDQRSEAFFKNGRLYIIGMGDYLVYGSWNDGNSYELRRVAGDVDTYIPTTTININCDRDKATDVQGVLDMPNLMTPKRINQLVGSVAGSSWTLDSPIEDGSEVRIRHEIFDDMGNISEAVYVNGYTRKEAVDPGMIPGFTDTIIPGEVVEGSNVLYRYRDEPYEYGEEIPAVGSIDFKNARITLDIDSSSSSNIDNLYVTFGGQKISSGERVRVYTGSSTYTYTVTIPDAIKNGSKVWVEVKYGSGTVNYYINEFTNANGEIFEAGGDKLYRSKIYYYSAGDTSKPSPSATINFEKGTITFEFKTQTNDNYLANNITIRYIPEWNNIVEVSAEDEISADDICMCRFGMLFGANGNTDRLFVSGNENRPNIDYYSAADDLTYFTAEQTTAFGSDNFSVVGYARLSDTTQIIYKEQADAEASIYYRTGAIREYTDEDGKLCDGETVFPITAGAIGEAAIARGACVNLAGDVLMLSRNGVFGVVLGENIVSSERYTRERSRVINKRLCAHSNLKNAVGVVFENKYYLAVDGVCYVADAGYKYSTENSSDGSYQYEWYYLDNIPAITWAVIDDKLYFGTADGRICVFDGEYTDRTAFTCYGGELGFSASDGIVTCSTSIEDALRESGEFCFISKVYGLYEGIRSAVVSDGRIYAGDAIFGIYDGTEVYVDCVGESGLEECGRYTVTDACAVSRSFRLANESGEVVLNSGGFRLHRLLTGRKLKAVDVADGHFRLMDTAIDREVSVSNFGGILPMAVKARLYSARNVVAEWYSPVLDLGTNMALKTVLGLSVVVDSIYGGHLTVGLQTRLGGDRLELNGAKVFSFDNLSFEDMAFETSFASSHTFRLNCRNVNYIIFRYISDDDRGCAVDSLSVLYKINKNNRGVW